MNKPFDATDNCIVALAKGFNSRLNDEVQSVNDDFIIFQAKMMSDATQMLLDLSHKQDDAKMEIMSGVESGVITLRHEFGEAQDTLRREYMGRFDYVKGKLASHINTDPDEHINISQLHCNEGFNNIPVSIDLKNTLDDIICRNKLSQTPQPATTCVSNAGKFNTDIKSIYSKPLIGVSTAFNCNTPIAKCSDNKGSDLATFVLKHRLVGDNSYKYDGDPMKYVEFISYFNNSFASIADDLQLLF